MNAASFKVSDEDLDLIQQIAVRANKMDLPGENYISLMMTLTATHANGCELDLPRLLSAEDAPFKHDLVGLSTHLDRVTGKLTDNFWPKYAKKGAQKQTTIEDHKFLNRQAVRLTILSRIAEIMRDRRISIAEMDRATGLNLREVLTESSPSSFSQVVEKCSKLLGVDFSGGAEYQTSEGVFIRVEHDMISFRVPKEIIGTCEKVIKGEKETK